MTQPNFEKKNANVDRYWQMFDQPRSRPIVIRICYTPTPRCDRKQLKKIISTKCQRRLPIQQVTANSNLIATSFRFYFLNTDTPRNQFNIYISKNCTQCRVHSTCMYHVTETLCHLVGDTASSWHKDQIKLIKMPNDLSVIQLATFNSKWITWWIRFTALWSTIYQHQYYQQDIDFFKTSWSP